MCGPWKGPVRAGWNNLRWFIRVRRGIKGTFLVMKPSKTKPFPQETILQTSATSRGNSEKEKEHHSFRATVCQLTQDGKGWLWKCHMVDTEAHVLPRVHSQSAQRAGVDRLFKKTLQNHFFLTDCFQDPDSVPLSSSRSASPASKPTALTHS